MKGFLGHRPRLDVVRGSLVFAGADRARSDELGLIAERKWSQDVYCHLKGVPTFLAFAAAPDDRCALELRCALSWRATGDDSVRGVHEFALELRDWRDLGYGARLEWLDDAMRKFLCRALAMRLETRHGAPVFRVGRDDCLLWPCPESRCAFPDDGVDVPDPAPTRTGSTRSGPMRAPGAVSRKPRETSTFSDFGGLSLGQFDADSALSWTVDRLCTSSRDLDTKIARVDSYNVMLK